MGTVVTGLMTFEEFERLPEHVGKQELLNGELIELPPAKRKHNVFAETFRDEISDVLRELRRTRPDLPLGKAHQEMGYRVTRNPDSWLVPDASLTHPNQPGDDYYEGAPLIAVEIVSESNTARQIAGKIKLYLSNGSKEVWVVYPELKAVWVYRDNTARLVEDKLETDLIPTLSIDIPSALQ